MDVHAHAQEALLRKALELVDDRPCGRGSALGVGQSGCHLLRQVERPTTGEHGEPGEHAALVIGQQLMAPVDGTAKGPLAVGRVATAATKVQAGVEAAGECDGRQQPHTCGRQLDREREPVQSSHDVGDGCRTVSVQPEARADQACPLEEQAARLRCSDDLRIARARRRQLEWRYLVLLLAGDAERGTARRDDDQLTSVPEQVGHHRSA